MCDGSGLNILGFPVRTSLAILVYSFMIFSSLLFLMRFFLIFLGVRVVMLVEPGVSEPLEEYVAYIMLDAIHC